MMEFKSGTKEREWEKLRSQVRRLKNVLIVALSENYSLAKFHNEIEAVKLAVDNLIEKIIEDRKKK
jgi:hypothetical protein